MSTVPQTSERAIRHRRGLSPRLNRFVGHLAASPLGWLLPAPWALLRYTGRRSGRRFAVPVGVYAVDGRTVAFTGSRWQANFVGGGPVEVVYRGRVWYGTATTIRDPGYAAELMLKLLTAGRPPGHLGLALAPGQQPTRAALVAMRRSVVELRLRRPVSRTNVAGWPGRTF